MDVLDGLNSEQRRAAEAVRGPVGILAGAGSGKTTTITRRIAWQVASGAFRPGEILAVTFTDKAASVMRTRLVELGVVGVDARTFHSAALAQLHRYAPDRVGRILPTKALLLRQIANALPPPYKFRPAGDLATEIERAKAGRVTPDGYIASLDGHEPPIPANLMHTVYREYERRKRQRGEIDFEDVLELAVGLFEADEQARADVRDRYRTFTVDEYQDVNLLQQTLLDLWLGSRDDVCVVGDDYQSIYAFTGASPRWLLRIGERFSGATIARLEENYRSSPQVLELANRLVPKLGGSEKVLRATQPDGPMPVLRPCPSPEAEDAWLVEELRGLHASGTALEEVAILCRTNARLADFEEVLHEAGLPFQGASLLGREAARRLLRSLDRDGGTAVAERVRALALDAGWLEQPPEKLGERELTRQADLGRLVKLAGELDDGVLTGAEFVAELRRRFDPGGEGARGINLLTYHRSKGLEFEAVFLPRLDEKELPSRQARTPDEQAEERRLLYVAITRAKRRLALTWSRRPSPFLTELGVASSPATVPVTRTARTPRNDSPAADLLRRWRLERARADAVPPYVVFPDRTIDELLARRPASVAELASVHGLGPGRIGRFGEELYAVFLCAVAADGDVSPSAHRASNGSAPIPPPSAPPPAHPEPDPAVYDALAAWRRRRAADDTVPAYHVFANGVLAAIAGARPTSHDELLRVPGVGPAKLERYGDQVLEVIAKTSVVRLPAVA